MRRTTQWMEMEMYKREVSMKPKLFFALAVWMAFVTPGWAEAEKVIRIGGLISGDSFIPAFEGFKKRMTELGYIEGKNIIYDLRNSKRDRERLKRLAADLVQSKPDLIVTSSTTATVPVAKVTKGTNIPVVFLSAGNPLKVVKSYASSGNNLTGISSGSLELLGKRMELLKELVPQLKRVIVLQAPSATNYEKSRRLTEEAAKRLGLEIAEVQALNVKHFKEKILPLINRQLGQAFFLPPVSSSFLSRKMLAEHLIKEKIPSVGPNVQYARAGMLAAYSSDYYELGRQGAILVDKVLKGAWPTDLPIEMPFKLKLVINLKTAKAIGLKIPKEILLRADEVIE